MQQDSLHISLPVDSTATADSVVFHRPSFVRMPPLEPDTTATGYAKEMVAQSPLLPGHRTAGANTSDFSYIASDASFFSGLNNPLSDSVRAAMADSAFQRKAYASSQQGHTAERQAYSVSGDDYITGLLLVTTFLAVYVVVHGKKFLQNHNLLPTSRKQSANEPHVTTSLEIQAQLFLILETCFTLGIIATSILEHLNPTLSLTGTPYALLAIATAAFFVFYLLKIALYSFINSIFFDRATLIRWNDTYLFSIFLQGMLLLPVTLLVIYAGISLSWLIGAWAVMFGVAKVFLFVQAFGIFPKKKTSVVHILLYLCSVEIIPPILVGRTLTSFLTTFLQQQELF